MYILYNIIYVVIYLILSIDKALKKLTLFFVDLTDNTKTILATKCY